MRTVKVTVKKSFSSLFTKAVTPGQQDAAMQALADKYEGKVRKQLLEAFQAIKDDARLEEIVGLILRQAPEQLVFDALGLSTAGVRLAPVLLTLSNLFTDAGIQAARQAEKGILGGPSIIARFDNTDPFSVEYLRSSSSNLITRITEDVKENVRQVLGDIQADPRGTPMVAARQLRDMVGLTVRQQRSLDNYKSYLENGDARALDRSIGGTAERVVSAAIRDGSMTPSKIERLVNSYRGRLLTQRAGVIASTETFRSMNAGAHQAWKQIAKLAAEDGNDLRRFWVSTNDSHTRESHIAIPEMNANGVGLDEHFKSPLGLILYPGDPDADPANSINCRCRIVVRYASTPAGLLPPMIAGRSYLPGVADFVNQTIRR